MTQARQREHFQEALRKCCEPALINRVRALIVHRHTDKPTGDPDSIETYFGVVNGGGRKLAADFLREYGVA